MIKQITAAVLLAATSFAASAAEPKFYVGGDVGSTHVDDMGTKTSAGVFAGYNINETFAVEVGFRRLAKWTVEVEDVSANVKIDQTAVSVLAFAPVAEHFAVYGRLGYNHNSVKGSASSATASATSQEKVNGALYGVGVSYEFTKAVTGRLEFQKPTSDSHNISLGVAYNF